MLTWLRYELVNGNCLLWLVYFVPKKSSMFWSPPKGNTTGFCNRTSQTRRLRSSEQTFHRIKVNDSLAALENGTFNELALLCSRRPRLCSAQFDNYKIISVYTRQVVGQYFCYPRIFLYVEVLVIGLFL